MGQEPKQGFTQEQMSSFTETVQEGPWWIPGYSVPEDAEEFHTARYSTGLLHVNQSMLVWNLIDSEDGSVLDQVSITNKY